MKKHLITLATMVGLIVLIHGMNKVGLLWPLLSILCAIYVYLSIFNILNKK